MDGVIEERGEGAVGVNCWGLGDRLKPVPGEVDCCVAGCPSRAGALKHRGAPGVGVVGLAGGVGFGEDLAEAEVPGAEALDLEVFVVVQGHLPVAGEVVATLNGSVVERARLGVAGLELLAAGGVG